MRNPILRAVVSVCLTTAAAIAQLSLPRLATSDLYVGDFSNDRVCVYDAGGNFLRSFTAPGLDGPRGIVFASNGKLYVASQNSDSVFVFDGSEQPLGQLTAAALRSPTGVAESPSGELLVSSFGTAQVCVFDSSDTYTRSIGVGVLGQPNCASFDGRGHLWVADVSGARVVEFDANEQFVASHRPSAPYTLSSPMSIARDHCDNLWVSGGGSGNLLQFTTAGNFVGELTHPDLSGPQGIAFDERGHLFSSSYFSDRVVEFDANGNWVQTITAGGLRIPRSLAFKPAGDAALTPLGCGVNPAGSISALSGAPRIGSVISIGLDNPVGTQAPSTTSAWLLGSFRAYAPCGLAVPGFGMASPGAAGEWLIDLGFPHFVIGSGTPWTGPGQPSVVTLGLPQNCDLVGRRVYMQGVLLDLGAGAPVPIGLTDAVEMLIGG